MHSIIEKRHNQLYGNPQNLVRAPGRINLIGEHTDYNNGFVFPAAINLEIYFAINKTDHPKSKVYSEDLSEEYSFEVSNPKAIPEMGWTKYISGVIKVLQFNGYELKNFEMTFGGKLPLGSGLSSSAALECGFIKALDFIFDLNIPNDKLIKIAQMAEHQYAGVQCGIMDQFAVTYGKAGHALKLDCRSMDYRAYPVNMDKYTFLLIDSNVKHKLAETEYNTRRKECTDAVNILFENHRGSKSLRDANEQDLIRVSDRMPDILQKRARFVIEENERVISAAKALEEGNTTKFGELMVESHEGLRDDYEVSCEEINFLVDMALETGEVLGSRIMGGGFGGCTLNLVKKDAVETLGEKITEQYFNKFNNKAKIFNVTLTKGVSEI